MMAEKQASRASQGKSAKPVLYMELDYNIDSRTDFGLEAMVRKMVLDRNDGSEEDTQRKVGLLLKAFNDDGKALRDAITNDGVFKVVKGIRPFLDSTVSAPTTRKPSTQGPDSTPLSRASASALPAVPPHYLLVAPQWGARSSELA
ncbi:hypothetical protein [Streptomyces sp. IB201691-2A2]|uniref:hypothetical protein n=1 Tax=Streptomyces sp. IB201691-2A2 TaxID=2561920 RepID=UPI00117E1711|nr:hypothetical protein [Streptomyces sp. IB201691-2A2]TRO56102.1 hypothetical protein E4K73_48045 [Streptomyces sp. IB201691-2A2]